MISWTNKPALRTRMFALRREAAATRPDAGLAVSDNFPDAWLPGEGAVVAGYWPLIGELDPRPLMRRLAASGARLCLPVVRGEGQALEFRAYATDDPLDTRAMGVQEPRDCQPTCRPDLVLVPLLACDRAGNRIGFGKGYYDHTLAALRRSGSLRAVGLAFDCQRVAGLPAEGHDEPLDGLVTESGVFCFDHGAAFSEGNSGLT